MRARQYFGAGAGLTEVVVVGIPEPVEVGTEDVAGEAVELDLELLPQPVTATATATAVMVNSARFMFRRSFSWSVTSSQPYTETRSLPYADYKDVPRQRRSLPDDRERD